MSTEDQRAPRPADSPSNEPLVWLGPVEWATVMGRRRPSGFFVRLEDGGEEAFMELTSVDDRLLCCNEEYWPDVGERVRVRRLLSVPERPDAPRVTGRASAMEGIVYGFPTGGVSGFSRTVGTRCSGGGIGWDYVESEVLG